MTQHRGGRWRQNLAYGLGLSLGAIALALYLVPGMDALHARGPMNSGHEEVECASCHKQAPGSARQQIQANVRHWLGLREAGVVFGFRPVGNDECLACHERPNDRHPVFRFLEPRFAKVRAKIEPHRCLACHREHRGKRVTLAEIGYCVNCHRDTAVRKDPVDPSHERLIQGKRWKTCLGCHDFHGNHVMKTEKILVNAIPPHRIESYFRGGAVPYPKKVHHRAKKEGARG